MKTTLALIAMIAVVPAYASEYVDGYFKSDGTYVPPHFRSSPNSTKLDNYSTRGNANPYTGKEGTKNPYSYPSPSYGTGSSGYPGYQGYKPYQPYKYK